MGEWHRRAGLAGYAVTKDAFDATRVRQHTEAVVRFLANPHLCPQCKKPLDYNKRANMFCGRSCAAIFNNHPRKCSRCRQCNCHIRSDRTYCGVECRAASKIVSFEQLRTDVARKNFLILERGHVCWICNYLEWNGQPISLELDHIDGQSDNSAKENLRILCPNCHAQTPTYRSKNRKNGGSKRTRYRAMRMELANRKSFTNRV